jgi:hypothetical protein
MFEHVTASDTIERPRGKWQVREVGDHESGPVALQSSASAAEHFVRQVEARYFGRRIGILDEMLGDLSRPAADVEDISQALERKFSPLEQPLDHGRMEGDHAAGGQYGPLGTVVNVADFVSIFLEAHAAHQVVFQDTIDELPARAKRIGFVPESPWTASFRSSWHGCERLIMSIGGFE